MSDDWELVGTGRIGHTILVKVEPPPEDCGKSDAHLFASSRATAVLIGGQLVCKLFALDSECYRNDNIRANRKAAPRLVALIATRPIAGDRSSTHPANARAVSEYRQKMVLVPSGYLG